MQDRAPFPCTPAWKVMTLSLFDSRTRHEIPFPPDGSGSATMYVCGVTPYDTTHLGHAFTYCAFDVLHRALRRRGIATSTVQNVTDIDDAILRAAAERQQDWRSMGEHWLAAYIDDMTTLNVLPPDELPRATEAIAAIIEAIEEILAAEAAYEAAGSVYFATAAWPGYGRLSGIDREAMLAVANQRGNRPDDPGKRDPLDFPLWQARRPGEPWWDSPWGPGRPGWHIECSTLARHFLGPTIDLHAGGADLAFPHHESELAQAEAMGHHPFARHWLHTGLVRRGGEKMSKSVGNLVMLRDLLAELSPDGVRIYLLSHHYRSDWEHDGTAAAAAESRAQRLRLADRVESGPRSALAVEVEDLRRGFENALESDIDTGAALEILDALARRISAGARERYNLDHARQTLRDLGGVLGLRLAQPGPDPEVVAGWDRHRRRLLE
jgi:L-cysteine:1D-myo-inositol 2-amino-2-deoxy-alpha-D-glucopyranoside ligase